MGACADRFAENEVSVEALRDSCLLAGRLRSSPSSLAACESGGEVPVPFEFAVRSPNGQSSCEGVYTLAVAEAGWPQGMPVWRNDSGRWLYSSTDGTWSIGGSRARSSNFGSHAAHICSHVKHNGAMPDQVIGTWWRAQGQHFQEDLDVVITAFDQYCADAEAFAGCCGGQPTQDCRAEETATLSSGEGAGADAWQHGPAAEWCWRSPTPPGVLEVADVADGASRPWSSSRRQNPAPEPSAPVHSPDPAGPDRKPKAPLVPRLRSIQPHTLDICFQSSLGGQNQEVLVNFSSTPLGVQLDFTKAPAVVISYEPHLKATGLRTGMAARKICGLDATNMTHTEAFEFLMSECSRLPSRKRPEAQA